MTHLFCRHLKKSFQLSVFLPLSSSGPAERGPLPVFWIPDLLSFPDQKLPREEALSHLFLIWTLVLQHSVNIWTFDLFLNRLTTFSLLPSLTRRDGLAGWERKGVTVRCAVCCSSRLFTHTVMGHPRCSPVGDRSCRYSWFPYEETDAAKFCHLPKDWDTLRLISNLTGILLHV